MIPTYRSRLVSAGLCFLLAVPAVAAPAPETSELTLEQIMADPDWIGNPPEDPYWSDDGRSIYYEREREGIGEQKKDLYRVDSREGRPARRSASSPPNASRADAPGERNRQRTRKVYVVAGDIFVKDLKTGARCDRSPARRRTESEPHFLADGRRIWFRRGDDLLVYDVESGLLSQPAELKLDKDPADKEAHDVPARSSRPASSTSSARSRRRRSASARRTGRVQRADPTRRAAPLVPGQEGQDRDPLPLPFRRLARRRHLPETGRERVQAVEDAAVRHRERQRRDQGRAPQGRRRGAGRPSPSSSSTSGSTSGTTSTGPSCRGSRTIR